MKARRLILASLFSVLFSASFLTSGEWAGTRVDRPTSSQSPKAPGSTMPEDPLTSAAGRHWRSGQPHHWRALLLQR